jgi:anti-sigma factor RsiW
MQCDRTGELIGAYIDQELDAATRREVAAHLGSCPECSALAQDLQRAGRQVAALGREAAPVRLGAAIRSRLDRASAEPPAPAGPPAPAWSSLHPVSRSWLARAAVVLALCGLTAAATALLMLRMGGPADLERDAIAAHIRSLLQDSPTQIASSESHTVKPWFAGRLEFAPAVKELAAEGFPLAGARLDYVGERRVAALVYRRRLHVVNVFLWPSADAAGSAPRAFAYRGYNVLAWSKGGIAYRAVSDLNIEELRQLQGLL